MPTRRLVLALAVLMFGVLGVGVVTALTRAGDGAKPRATGDPLDGRTPGVTAPPVAGDPVLPTTPPPTTPEPATPEPAASATASPTAPSTIPPSSPAPGSGDGDSGDGGGDPAMPKTGASALLAAAAVASLAGATAVRRLAR